jgi:hypothetical protein
VSIYATLITFDGDEHPQPYRYDGSSVVPMGDTPRALDLGVAAVKSRWPFVRITQICQDAHETGVVLDASQVRTLCDALTGWLESLGEQP